jgi:hypothetical protein
MSEILLGTFVDALTGEVVERELTTEEIADLQVLIANTAKIREAE